MIKLMKLELQRINLRPYVISSIIFGIILLVLNYFAAYMAMSKQEADFLTYHNIFLFTGGISILLFSILSATMYTKLIIEEYSGKRLALLFSYPMERKKIFIAKILIVFLFVMLSMLLCTTLPICIFATTESFAPILSDTMTNTTLLSAFGTTVISLVAVSAIGLSAMRIGFIKKSIPATLISAFILAGIYGNIAISSTGNFMVSTLIFFISFVAIFTIIVTLSIKLNHMEVI